MENRNYKDDSGEGLREAGPLRVLCENLKKRAVACRKEMNYSQAISLLEKALEFRTDILRAEKTKETILSFGETCRLLADCHDRAGDSDRARYFYEKGLAALSAENMAGLEPEAMAVYFRDMARFYETIRMADRAVYAYEKALDCLRRIPDRSSEAAEMLSSICMDCADIFYYGHHDVKKARELLEEGIRACEGHAGIKLTQVVMENRLRSWK